jgi:hypothetical protein
MEEVLLVWLLRWQWRLVAVLWLTGGGSKQ